jgi:hypothetical protein
VFTGSNGSGLTNLNLTGVTNLFARTNDTWWDVNGAARNATNNLPNGAFTSNPLTTIPVGATNSFVLTNDTRSLNLSGAVTISSGTFTGNGGGLTNLNPNIGFGTNYTVLTYTQSTNAFVDVSLGSKFALTLTTNTYIVFTNYASFPMKDVEVWLTQGANLTNQVAYMTNSTCMPFVFGQILTMPTNGTQSSCLTCGNLNPSGIFRFTQNITSP